MVIKVRNEEIKLWIPVPMGLVFNDLTAAFLPKVMAQNGMTITPKQARKLMRGIRKCWRRHRGLTLVEIESAYGQSVEFKL